jgi:hypothetical protein
MTENETLKITNDVVVESRDILQETYQSIAILKIIET